MKIPRIACAVTLMVRAHSGTLGTGTSITVVAYPDGHTMEDPASEFQGGTSLGSCEFNDQTTTNGTLDGVYLTDELTAGSMGQMINVVLRATQASPAVSSLDARISVDLSLKW